MHTKSIRPSTYLSAENPQVYYPSAYNAVPSGSTRRRQHNSISTTSSASSSRPSMEARRDSCQNSTGSHDTKRSLKTGFLKPAQTAQFDFLVERFKHRKEASKEGLTAANLKALENL